MAQPFFVVAVVSQDLIAQNGQYLFMTLQSLFASGRVL
ncbi:hypothetical protein TRICHSKD4_3645 [Roseibium sp. TrichSKD4]|nr:hypothetical protein TRICHSKD4_3645 [Roseibium sp. TrichSKD4]